MKDDFKRAGTKGTRGDGRKYRKSRTGKARARVRRATAKEPTEVEVSPAEIDLDIDLDAFLQIGLENLAREAERNWLGGFAEVGDTRPLKGWGICNRCSTHRPQTALSKQVVGDRMEFWCLDAWAGCRR